MAFIKKEIIIAASLILWLSWGSTAFGQQAPGQGNKSVQPQLQTEDISDEELKQFVQASAKAAVVQQESQQAMVAVVEEEKLSVEKFTEMAKANQEQKLDQVKATPEERTAFTKAAKRIMEMQPQVEQNIQQAVVKEGISLEKFEQIMLAYQQSPAIQARVQKLLDQRL